MRRFVILGHVVWWLVGVFLVVGLATGVLWTSDAHWHFFLAVGLIWPAMTWSFWVRGGWAE